MEKNNPKINYDGPERREYCAQHCALSETAKKSVPRWAFLSSLSTMVIVAIAFAGWHVAALNKMEFEFGARATVYENHIIERIESNRRTYNQDVNRFIKTAESNHTMLRELRTDIGITNLKQARVETKLELVLEKIKKP